MYWTIRFPTQIIKDPILTQTMFLDMINYWILYQPIYLCQLISHNNPMKEDLLLSPSHR